MMNALIVSNLLLWLVVIAMGVVIVALLRQIGVLYERVAPAGALMLNKTLRVGMTRRRSRCARSRARRSRWARRPFRAAARCCSSSRRLPGLQVPSARRAGRCSASAGGSTWCSRVTSRANSTAHWSSATAWGAFPT